MKSVRLLSLLAATSLSYLPAAHAQQNVPGAGVTPLNATGITQGVNMTASGGTGTLTVGTIGGAQTNIFTNNNPLVPGAVAVSTDASSTANIQFNSSSTVFGNIGVTQPGGPFFLGISGGNTGTVVNFLGPVFATTTNVLGTGTLNFNSGSINITATNFAGDGFISLAPNSTVIGALTTTAGANTGSLALGGGSTLDGAVGGAIGLRAIDVIGGNSIAGVTATITGLANTFSSTLGTNTLNVNGALTIANAGVGGVINTTLASAAVFGSIRPVGATNLGPTLLVNVTVASGANLAVGTVWNIVQTRAGTPQSGTNGTIVTVVSATPGFVFAAVPGAGTVNGLVSIVLLAAPPPIPPIPPAPPIAEITVGQLTSSPVNLAASLVTFEATRLFQNLLLTRFNEIMCSQVRQRRANEEMPDCPQNRTDGGWWLKAFGALANQGTQGLSAGYNSSIAGFMMAYDAPVGPNTHAGVGVGYSRSTIGGYAGDAQAGFNTYRTTAYIGHEPGPWFIYGDASFGFNTYSGSRTLSSVTLPGGSSSMQSSYNGQEYTATATTGYHFYTQGITITPLASLQYTHLSLAGYGETGGGALNLTVQSQSYDFLQSGLGATFARPFAFMERTMVPEVHGKWYHMLSNPTIVNTVSLTSGALQSYTTPGLTNSADTFNLGGGLTFLSCGCSSKNWAVEAVYDYYWRPDNYSAHQGMLRVSGRF